MRRTPWLVLLAACGGGRASAPDAQVAEDTTAAPAVVPDTTFPAAQQGALVIRSALPGPWGGKWRPMAGVCREPPALQLLATGDSVDVVLLAQWPSDSTASGTYRVAVPEDSTLSPRSARIGVQLVSYADRALRGERGWVELSRLDQVVSGRFDLVLGGFSAPDTVRYLGVFDGIPVDSLPDMACRATPPGIPAEVH